MIQIIRNEIKADCRVKLITWRSIELSFEEDYYYFPNILYFIAHNLFHRFRKCGKMTVGKMLGCYKMPSLLIISIKVTNSKVQIIGPQ